MSSLTGARVRFVHNGRQYVGTIVDGPYVDPPTHLVRNYGGSPRFVERPNPEAGTVAFRVDSDEGGEFILPEAVLRLLEDEAL